MADETTKCVFCNIINGKIKSEIVKNSTNFIAIKDINPISEGHSLIIPKSHYVSLLDLPESLGVELIKFTKELASDMIKNGLGNGFNIIMNNFHSAGQFVMHAHLHVIPRKDNDGIRYFVKE
ncbi:MAG: HIT family protein [Candidatus Pacearchaeota archaeon]